MNIVFAREGFPTATRKSIFLAGPTPRAWGVESWRPTALKLLGEAGFDGDVYLPESRDGVPNHDYIGQVDWEEEGLHRADCILFWIPRNQDTMLALTTNDEWGFWKSSGKVVLGAPENAHRVRYQQHYAKKFGVPTSTTLQETIATAISFLQGGADRVGGECNVPYNIWKTPSFQSWYQAQKAAGNRLDGARVQWKAPLGHKNAFLWAMHVNVHVREEGRNKSNEIIVSRPNVSQVVLYSERLNIDRSEVVLVKEFRSPASINDGFVRDLPGGSSPDAATDPILVAAEEVEEEVGLKLSHDRFVPLGTCQLAATVTAHKAHLFSVILTAEELEWVRSQKGIAKGLHDGTESTERTYAEVWTYEELLKQDVVDWTTLGMVSRALHR